MAKTSRNAVTNFNRQSIAYLPRGYGQNIAEFKDAVNRGETATNIELFRAGQRRNDKEGIDKKDISNTAR